MCYKYPGPRCSSHALKKLNEALRELGNTARYSSEDGDKTWCSAMDKVKHAQEEFDMTPLGQKRLSAQIEQGLDHSGMLQMRLDYGKQQRMLALAALRDQELGVEATHNLRDAAAKVESEHLDYGDINDDHEVKPFNEVQHAKDLTLASKAVEKAYNEIHNIQDKMQLIAARQNATAESLYGKVEGWGVGLAEAESNFEAAAADYEQLKSLNTWSNATPPEQRPNIKRSTLRRLVTSRRS